MPDPVSVGGAKAAHISRAREDCGMIALRFDLLDEEAAGAVSKLLGAELPERGRFESNGEAMIAWMAPDELLVILPFPDLEECLASIAKLGREALLSATDVSDMRIVFEVSGPCSRDVVAKGSPLDLSSGAFGPGSFRRTRLGQVAAMAWMPEEPTICIACRRSEADYVEKFLEVGASSAAPGFYVGG
ncbi:MAG: sarcosine oxidase subunit gamma [Albidovulum sp.]|nr:sarcosine oxidase subunit gamma [Albidovulum sp.]